MNDAVSEKFCDERHKVIKDKESTQDRQLNEHSQRISTMEDAVLKLTILVEQSKKRDIFDKILTICMFIICMVLVAIVLGPEVASKMIGGLN